MCDRNDPNFVGRNVIENTVREPAKDKTAPGSTEDRADVWIHQNATYGSIKFGDKREAKLGIRARGIESSRIVQFAKRKRDSDYLHFSAARTLASASAIGMT